MFGKFLIGLLTGSAISGAVLAVASIMADLPPSMSIFDVARLHLPSDLSQSETPKKDADKNDAEPTMTAPSETPSSAPTPAESPRPAQEDSRSDTVSSFEKEQTAPLNPPSLTEPKADLTAPKVAGETSAEPAEMTPTAPVNDTPEMLPSPQTPETPIDDPKPVNEVRNNVVVPSVVEEVQIERASDTVLIEALIDQNASDAATQLPSTETQANDPQSAAGLFRLPELQAPSDTESQASGFTN